MYDRDIDIRYNTKVKKIIKKGEHYLVESDKEEEFDIAIVATLLNPNNDIIFECESSVDQLFDKFKNNYNYQVDPLYNYE